MAGQQYVPGSTGTGLRKAIDEGRFGGYQGGGKTKTPVHLQKKRRRSVPLTKEKKIAFLEELEKHGNVSAACSIVGITKKTLYAHRENDEWLRDQMEIAKATCLRRLQYEKWSRIYDGVETIEYDGEGEIIKRTVKKDNDLLKVALRALDPETYSVPVGQAGVQVNIDAGGGKALEKLAAMLNVQLPQQEEGRIVEADWDRIEHHQDVHQDDDME